MHLHEQVTAHACDWAHLATAYRKGKTLVLSNPYYGQLWTILSAIHLTHSIEQRDLLLCLAHQLLDDWERNGEHQAGKMTTQEFRLFYMVPPNNTWTIGSFDGMTTDCKDLPGCAPTSHPLPRVPTPAPVHGRAPAHSCLVCSIGCDMILLN